MAFGLYAGGSGTVLDPFLVEDIDDLNAVRHDDDYNFKQICDIQADPSVSFRPIAYMSGYYDGSGFSILDLNIKRIGSWEEAGLFTQVTRLGEVRNLNLINLSIRATGCTGGIAIYNYGNIKNCSVQGNISSTDINQDGTGGIVGNFRSGLIEDCRTDINITGKNHVGGIVGYADSEGLTRCESFGAVTGNESVGGIAGYSFYDITDCKSSCDIDGVTNVGGINGFGYGWLKRCVATGYVTGLNEVGGITGGPDKLEGCFALMQKIGAKPGADLEFFGEMSGYSYRGITENCYSLDTFEIVQL